MKMTTRQWELYKLLMSDPNKQFTQEEICSEINGYVYKERNNDKCSNIRADKIVINAGTEVDKIVVCSHYKFKIATEEEYKAEHAKHIYRLKKSN